MKRRVIIVLGVLVAVLALALIVPGTRWRLQIVAAKARGRIPDLGWADLIRMIRPGSGVYLEPLAENGYNPYLAISDPLTAPEDVKAGGALFAAQCSTCHGSGPHASAAPDLSRGEFRHGG
ncbi:MAG TPA: hypothetical protein VH163_11445, partial [Gemmatimonadales bacterium]|nr:hypothetical protein [Gemmatimonadales bacterium]